MFHIPPVWHDDCGGALHARPRDERAHREDVPRPGEQQDGARHVGQRQRPGLDVRRGVPGVSARPRDAGRGDRRAARDRSRRSSGCTSTTPSRRRPTPQLLQRIKNSVEAQYLQSLAGTGIAGTLARMEVAYRWQYIEEQFKQRMAVTAGRPDAGGEEVPHPRQQRHRRPGARAVGPPHRQKGP